MAEENDRNLICEIYFKTFQSEFIYCFKIAKCLSTINHSADTTCMTLNQSEESFKIFSNVRSSIYPVLTQPDKPKPELSYHKIGKKKPAKDKEYQIGKKDITWQQLVRAIRFLSGKN